MDGKLISSDSATITQSIVIPPCYIGDGVVISNSVVGPHVSLGTGSVVQNSNIANCIIQQHAKISQMNIADSMIGNHVTIHGKTNNVSLGDYTEWHE
jgi:glucose-1-phosphate thymidylyltransferase